MKHERPDEPHCLRTSRILTRLLETVLEDHARPNLFPHHHAQKTDTKKEFKCALTLKMVTIQF